MKEYAEYASMWACKNVVHFYFLSICTCTNTHTKSHQNYLANFGAQQVARRSKNFHESLDNAEYHMYSRLPTKLSELALYDTGRTHY